MLFSVNYKPLSMGIDPLTIMTNFTRMHNDYLDPDRHIPNWCDDNYGNWDDDWNGDDDSPDPIPPDEEYNLPFEWQNDLLNDYF